MSNLIASVIFILSLFISASPQAQQLTNEWRLEKKSWVLPNGESSLSEYIYDALGRMYRIKHYENKKLQSTQGEFMYDKAGHIVSYKEFYPGGTDTMHYFFTYGDENRVLSVKEIKHKSTGEKQTTLTRVFSYNSKEIRESMVQPSFGGKLTDEITYSLDEKGNMVRKISIQNSKKTADYIYGEYDNKPNPLIFTVAYFYTQLLSKQNSKEGYWENDKPAKTFFTYSTNAMLQKTVVTYMLDNRPYTHKYTYSYSKIKSASKAVIK